MPIKKSVDAASVKEPKSTALNFSVVREWGDVATEIQKLREAGLGVPVIAEQLQVNEVLVNQCVLQSYKMVINSVEVFRGTGGETAKLCGLDMLPRFPQ